MPNKTIYLSTIKDFEKSVGFSVINQEEVAEKLQKAWKKDTTQAKVDYLVAYGEVFRDVLKKWSDSEFLHAFSGRLQTMPDIKKCLLKTDEALKLCAMSLIPELRENEDVLSHMTFGVIDPTKLKNEFIPVRNKYLQASASENAMKKRKDNAYNKYKGGWLTSKTQKITELVRDEGALNLMSQDEKIDYALALESYRNDATRPFPLSENEKGLIDDSLNQWKQVIGCENGETLEDFVANQYFSVKDKLNEDKWLDNELNEAIAEYNANPNPAKREIENYKQISKRTEDAKKLKERTNNADKITDEVAQAFGDFFKQEELTQEVKEVTNIKERLLLQEKIDKFNKEYSLNIGHTKIRTSVEQLSVLMIKAREEKQRFLSENSVVVIENGKETCYDYKEYYKEFVKNANEVCAEKIKKIEEERQLEEKKYKELISRLEKTKDAMTPEDYEKANVDNDKSFKLKNKELNRAVKKAKEELEDKLYNVKGGIVIEKNGDTEKEYKATRYYETHETKKEQYAYGEYQKIYSRIYKDACKNVKEQNYKEGKITDFSHVAKDIDNLLKTAMYISNVYDDPKNEEIIQKCSFGGLSAEKLASYATSISGDSWKKEQSSGDVWSKQSDKAKKILAKWNQDAKNNPKHSNIIKEQLEKCAKDFDKSRITRKEMLDYMLAADSHLQTNYPTRLSRMLSFVQYNRVKNSLDKCYTALGLKENSPLRVAMNDEYKKMADYMSKEKVFNSIETRMGYALGFSTEKFSFEKEHKQVHDREIARKTSELEELKSTGKEPYPIKELDEKQTILNQQPRSKQISLEQQKQPQLNVDK